MLFSLYIVLDFCILFFELCFLIIACQGDTKSSAKGGEASAKKDVQPSPNAQVKYMYMHYAFVA